MKKVLFTLMTGLVFVGLPAGVANAWTFSMKGQGVCQQDGSYKITWTVNNSTESQPLRITKSSNTSVVAVGDTVPAKQKKDFIQNASGTQAATFKLALEGDWESDTNDRKREATVILDKACMQPIPPETPPVTPPTGGQGGGVVQSAQVVAPVGAVNAGLGKDVSPDVIAIAGLGASLGAVAFGLHQVRKYNQ